MVVQALGHRHAVDLTIAPDGTSLLRARHVARRWQIYAAVSPLLRRLGYREVTMDSLAHACSLNPSSLYHYFGSKLELAVFPLTAQSGWCDVIEAIHRESAGDSRAELRAFIGALADRGDELRLALRLANEIGAGADPRTAEALAETVGQARHDLGGLLRQAAPQLAADAEDLAEALLVILTGELPGVDRGQASVRRQMWATARAYLDAASAPIPPVVSTPTSALGLDAAG